MTEEKITYHDGRLHRQDSTLAPNLLLCVASPKNYRLLASEAKDLNSAFLGIFHMLREQGHSLAIAFSSFPPSTTIANHPHHHRHHTSVCAKHNNHVFSTANDTSRPAEIQPL